MKTSTYRVIMAAAFALLALRHLAQTTGDIATFKKASGPGDVKTYTTPVNSSLYSLNSSGNFSLLPQSTFQSALISGTNLRTVQGTSLLGSGNINIIDDAINDGVTVAGPSQNAVFDALAGKAASSHTHVSADITDASAGGNGVADAGKLLKFDPRGGIAARTDDAFSVDPAGDFRSSGIATSISAVSTGSGDGIYAQASSGIAIAAVAGDQTAIRGFNNSTTLPSLEVYNDDPTNVGPIAHFHDDAGDGMEVLNDGGLFWTSATGAQTTATNLPIFGALTKGVVPAAGAVPSTSKFLDETGNWSTPPDTTGITQLTGDVTAGPGSGSQAATLASVITAGGPTGSASVVPVITYDAKGRLTAVTTATITPAAIGAPSGSGTSTGTNTGDQTNITGNAGTATALQTARTIQTNLASTSSASFDGTANITPGVTGTLPIGNGGTGAATREAAEEALTRVTESTPLASDFTTSSTSATNVTELSIAVAANSTYRYEVWCEWASNNTSGTVTPNVTGPAGATVTGYRQATLAASTVTNGAIGISTAAAGTANSRQFMVMHGICNTSGTSGTLQVTLASSSGHTARIYAGATIRATKVQ